MATQIVSSRALQQSQMQKTTSLRGGDSSQFYPSQNYDYKSPPDAAVQKYQASQSYQPSNSQSSNQQTNYYDNKGSSSGHHGGNQQSGYQNKSYGGDKGGSYGGYNGGSYGGDQGNNSPYGRYC